MNRAVSVWAGVRTLLVVAADGADLGQGVEELGRVERRRRAGPELVVAGEQEAAPVLLAGAHGGAEGRRGRLPDARARPAAACRGCRPRRCRGRRRRARRGRGSPRTGRRRCRAPCRGRPRSRPGSRPARRRAGPAGPAPGRRACRAAPSRTRPAWKRAPMAVLDGAGGGDPADRPGTALGDRLGEGGGGDRLFAEVEPLERQRLVDRGGGRGVPTGGLGWGHG